MQLRRLEYSMDNMVHVPFMNYCSRRSCPFLATRLKMQFGARMASGVQLVAPHLTKYMTSKEANVMTCKVLLARRSVGPGVRDWY